MLYLKQIVIHIAFAKNNLRSSTATKISPKPQFINHFSILAYLRFSHSLYRCVHNSSES